LGEQRYRGNPRFPNAKFAYIPAPKFVGLPGLPNFQESSFLPGLLAFPQALFTLAGLSYRGTGQRNTSTDQSHAINLSILSGLFDPTLWVLGKR